MDTFLAEHTCDTKDITFNLLKCFPIGNVKDVIYEEMFYCEHSKQIASISKNSQQTHFVYTTWPTGEIKVELKPTPYFRC